MQHVLRQRQRGDPKGQLLNKDIGRLIEDLHDHASVQDTKKPK